MASAGLTFSLGSNTLTTLKYFDSTTNTYPAMAFSYCLYDAPDTWTTYKTYVETSSNNPTTNEQANLLSYQSYALQIVCDVSSLTI